MGSVGDVADGVGLGVSSGCSEGSGGGSSVSPGGGSSVSGGGGDSSSAGAVAVCEGRGVGDLVGVVPVVDVDAGVGSSSRAGGAVDDGSGVSGSSSLVVGEGSPDGVADGSSEGVGPALGPSSSRGTDDGDATGDAAPPGTDPTVVASGEEPVSGAAGAASPLPSAIATDATATHATVPATISQLCLRTGRGAGPGAVAAGASEAVAATTAG
ncbi:hypothetical protein ACFUVW_12825, partial [Isoptericola sp. NPDC057391]